MHTPGACFERPSFYFCVSMQLSWCGRLVISTVNPQRSLDRRCGPSGRLPTQGVSLPYRRRRCSHTLELIAVGHDADAGEGAYTPRMRHNQRADRLRFLASAIPCVRQAQPAMAPVLWRASYTGSPSCRSRSFPQPWRTVCSQTKGVRPSPGRPSREAAVCLRTQAARRAGVRHPFNGHSSH